MLKQIEKESIEGNIDNIRDLLEKFEKSKVYRAKVEQILRSAYLNQLLSKLVDFAKEKQESDKELLTKGVNNYLRMFGFDDEVGEIVEKLKALDVHIPIEYYDKALELRLDQFPNFIWDEI